MKLTNTVSRNLLLAAQITIGLNWLSPVCRGEVRVERIFMPNAHPSSFAVSLPRQMNFCFDPVRGALSYAWSGEFIDPTPARNGIGKFVDPVQLLGPLVYQESGLAPLRRNDAVRVPVVRFNGYTLRADSIEFRYTVDGLAIREEIRGRVDGTALERRLYVGSGGAATWWYVREGKPPVQLHADSAGILLLEVPFGKAPQ